VKKWKIKLRFLILIHYKKKHTRRNVVHFHHIFVVIMQLISKPIYFTTSNVLVLHVHVVACAITRRVEPNSSYKRDYNL
jgi:hypothetical protein